MHFRNELCHVLQGPEFGAYVLIVADVVAVVCQGRGVGGRDPDHVDAEVVQVGEFVDDAADVADSVAVAVAEGHGPDLVADGVLPPRSGWVGCIYVGILGLGRHGGLCEG